MFLSSLPLAMVTMTVETGNGKLRRSKHLWWGIGNAVSYLFAEYVQEDANIVSVQKEMALQQM